MSSHPIGESPNPIDSQIPDLRLLHHYITVTAPTLTHTPAEEDGFRGHVVKLGFDHPFLLHAMLSLAALHLSRLDASNSESYQLTAIRHHDIGLARFQADVDDITPSNFQAVLCFSTLVYPYYNGLPVPDNSGAEELWNMELQHLSLIKGVRPMAAKFWPAMLESELAKFMSPDVIGVDWEKTFDETEISHLRQLPETNIELLSDELKTTCMDAIRALEVMFASFPCQPAHASFSILKLWVHQMSSAFMDLLVQRHPATLVIYAHYAVLLSRSKKYWFLTGSSERILCSIDALLHGEWKDWLAWPRREICGG